jgi:hypothetical protein
MGERVIGPFMRVRRIPVKDACTSTASGAEQIAVKDWWDHLLTSYHQYEVFVTKEQKRPWRPYST